MRSIFSLSVSLNSSSIESSTEKAVVANESFAELLELLLELTMAVSILN